MGMTGLNAQYYKGIQQASYDVRVAREIDGNKLLPDS
jgi:hypothetical protein